jgi:hypothetical protein
VIRFNCGCGKRLKVDDAFAGRQVKCGGCGARIQVPLSDNGAASPAGGPASGLDELAKALQGAAKPAAGAATVRKGGQPAKNGQNGQNGNADGRPAAANHNKALFIGLGAALGFVLIVVILMVALSGGSKTPPPVKKEDPPPAVYSSPSAPKPKISNDFPGAFFSDRHLNKTPENPAEKTPEKPAEK